MTLVAKYGERWARHPDNIAKLKSKCGDPEGVYVLYDGSMPLYIGKGNIRRRLRGHRTSKSKGRYWDYFSWYEIKDEDLRHQLESVLLRLLPFYLRSLNKNRGKLRQSQKMRAGLELIEQPEPVKKDYHPPHRKRS